MTRVGGARFVQAIVALACAAGSAGCDHDGRILVVVASDYAVRGELGFVNAYVNDDPQPLEFPLRDTGTGDTPTEWELPLSFVVTPNATSPSPTVRLSITGFARAGDRIPLVGPTSRVVHGFVPGDTRLLPVHLSRACATARCPAHQYCDRGRCYPEDLRATDLPLIEDSTKQRDALDGSVRSTFDAARLAPRDDAASMTRDAG